MSSGRGIAGTRFFHEYAGRFSCEMPRTRLRAAARGAQRSPRERTGVSTAHPACSRPDRMRETTALARARNTLT